MALHLTPAPDDSLLTTSHQPLTSAYLTILTVAYTKGLGQLSYQLACYLSREARDAGAAPVQLRGLAPGYSVACPMSVANASGLVSQAYAHLREQLAQTFAPCTIEQV